MKEHIVALKFSDIREKAKQLGIDPSGLTKPKLVDAILVKVKEITESTTEKAQKAKAVNQEGKASQDDMDEALSKLDLSDEESEQFYQAISDQSDDFEDDVDDELTIMKKSFQNRKIPIHHFGSGWTKFENIHTVNSKKYRYKSQFAGRGGIANYEVIDELYNMEEFIALPKEWKDYFLTHIGFSWQVNLHKILLIKIILELTKTGDVAVSDVLHNLLAHDWVVFNFARENLHFDLCSEYYNRIYEILENAEYGNFSDFYNRNIEAYIDLMESEVIKTYRTLIRALVSPQENKLVKNTSIVRPLITIDANKNGLYIKIIDEEKGFLNKNINNLHSVAEFVWLKLIFRTSEWRPDEKGEKILKDAIKSALEDDASGRKKRREKLRTSNIKFIKNYNDIKLLEEEVLRDQWFISEDIEIELVSKTKPWREFVEFGLKKMSDVLWWDVTDVSYIPGMSSIILEKFKKTWEKFELIDETTMEKHNKNNEEKLETVKKIVKEIALDDFLV